MTTSAFAGMTTSTFAGMTTSRFRINVGHQSRRMSANVATIIVVNVIPAKAGIQP
jgi:hypothetical protein